MATREDWPKVLPALKRLATATRKFARGDAGDDHHKEFLKLFKRLEKIEYDVGSGYPLFADDFDIARKSIREGRETAEAIARQERDRKIEELDQAHRNRASTWQEQHDGRGLGRVR